MTAAGFRAVVSPLTVLAFLPGFAYRGQPGLPRQSLHDNVNYV